MEPAGMIQHNVINPAYQSTTVLTILKIGQHTQLENEHQAHSMKVQFMYQKGLALS